MTSIILIIFVINFGYLAKGVEYCIDWKCPTECCIDIYTCSPYSKCEIPRFSLGTKC